MEEAEQAFEVLPSFTLLSMWLHSFIRRGREEKQRQTLSEALKSLESFIDFEAYQATYNKKQQDPLTPTGKATEKTVFKPIKDVDKKANKLLEMAKKAGIA